MVETVDRIGHRMTSKNSSQILKVWNHCNLACSWDLSVRGESFQDTSAVFDLRFSGSVPAFSWKPFCNTLRNVVSLDLGVYLDLCFLPIPELLKYDILTPEFQLVMRPCYLLTGFSDTVLCPTV